MTRYENQSFRFTPKKSTFASLGSHLSQVGKVIDISLSGLTFEFLSDEKALVTSPHVDIFTLDGKYSLSGLPCSLIYQSAISIPGVKEDAENALMARRCELKYEDLNSDQCNFSITVGKPHVSKSLDSGFRRNDVLHFGNPLRHSGGSRNPECSACTY